jgi:hypothetical protein
MDIVDSKLLAKAPLDAKVRVLGGQWAPRKLYLRVAKDVSDRIPQLNANKLYRLQDIYGDALWASLGNAWVKRKAGRCFAHMVSIGKFPLKFVQYGRSATKRYQLKVD